MTRGLPSKARGSVGVARQYSGTLGKVGHGQGAVTCCYTDPQATWPVAVRWSLPEAWAEDLERRQQARVPAEVTFHTKPALALALLDQARAWGLPYRCVVADADDGGNPHFLAGLEGRQERYVVGVLREFRVSMGRAARSPVPRWQWRTIRGRQGPKGWRRKKFVAVRCWRVTADGQRPVGWLVGERATRGQPEEQKYHWSHLPTTATLEELAGYAHRWYAVEQYVEQFHEEAKGELGWDHYQSRLWPGFHRHAVMVMLAYSLLVWLELCQRHRQPRRSAPGPVFPLGRILAGIRCQRSIARSPGGCTSTPSYGG